MTDTACRLEPDDQKSMRERRCIVTGQVLSEDLLIRFVADPDGRMVPDIAARLPGRGYWVSAQRGVLEVAIAKNHFPRAAKASVLVPADLSERVESQLVRRLSDDLGLARRSGSLVLGFDGVARAMDARIAPDLLVEASDGSEDGRRKLVGLASARGRSPVVMDCLTSAELSLALGRENVVHAALNPGRLSERVRLDAGRLRGFRPAPRRNGP
ncbi:MAG TPA: RNA-binding protein [Rhizomicrobium sp.]